MVVQWQAQLTAQPRNTPSGAQALSFGESDGGRGKAALIEKDLAYRQPGQRGIRIMAGRLFVRTQGGIVVAFRAEGQGLPHG